METNDAPAREPGRCRSCGAEIEWGLSAKGRRMPYDLDGASHFTTCPDAKDWSKKGKR